MLFPFSLTSVSVLVSWMLYLSSLSFIVISFLCLFFISFFFVLGRCLDVIVFFFFSSRFIFIWLPSFSLTLISFMSAFILRHWSFVSLISFLLLLLTQVHTMKEKCNILLSHETCKTNRKWSISCQKMERMRWEEKTSIIKKECLEWNLSTFIDCDCPDFFVVSHVDSEMQSTSVVVNHLLDMTFIHYPLSPWYLLLTSYKFLVLLCDLLVRHGRQSRFVHHDSHLTWKFLEILASYKLHVKWRIITNGFYFHASLIFNFVEYVFKFSSLIIIFAMTFVCDLLNGFGFHMLHSSRIASVLMFPWVEDDKKWEETRDVLC